MQVSRPKFLTIFPIQVIYSAIMKRRFTFITLLVLSFYLFHALSPLLYSAGGAHAADQSESRPDASLTGYKPSPAEHPRYLEPAQDKDGDSSSAPSSRVLLKKKRALATSSKDVIAKLSQHYAKFSHFTPPSEIANITLPIPEHRPICPNGFQLYHSGTSPPSA
jgi:hypothetical protein